MRTIGGKHYVENQHFKNKEDAVDYAKWARGHFKTGAKVIKEGNVYVLYIQSEGGKKDLQDWGKRTKTKLNFIDNKTPGKTKKPTKKKIAKKKKKKGSVWDW